MLGRRILASSRYFIAIAVLGSFVSSVALLVYGALVVVASAWDASRHHDLSVHGVERLAVAFIQLTDVFLLGVVLYIVALRLYELFVDPDLPLPNWLRIADLDELKEKLVGVIIVLLGVTFLGKVVTWTGDDNILPLGAAIALVIGALGFVFVTTVRSRRKHEAADEG